MWDQFITFINTGQYTFLRCYSPGGDAAAALTHTAFYTTFIFSHHRATMQRPWRSLRSLSALVTLNNNNNKSSATA